MAARNREPDPPVRLAALRRDVGGGRLQRGYLVRGEEPYFRERALDVLKAAAEASGWEVRLHDADKADADFQLSTAVEDLSGGGLFATRRLVVLRNPGQFLKKDGSRPSALTRAITAFVGTTEEAGSVVLVGTGLRADLAAVKAIKKAGGEVLEMRKLWDSPPPWSPDPRKSELVQWLVARAREVGVRLDARQAVYVCAATGNDLAALDDQLERLRHSGGKEFREVIGWNADTEPWTVADRLLDGDPARGLSGVATLFSGGFREKSGRRLVDEVALANMLLNALVKGVRLGLALALALDKEPDETKALRAVGFGGAPRTGQAAVARARSRGAAAWGGMLEDLADLERRMKTGSSIDANDFTALALWWARTAAPRPGKIRR